MRTEVTVGQYLDILEESAWRDAADDEQRRRAQRVIVYKSAKYSVEAPLPSGRASAAGPTEQLASLRAVRTAPRHRLPAARRPARRLRRPAVTGKPAGDDLREGKRTVLVALTARPCQRARAACSTSCSATPNSTTTRSACCRRRIRDSGAVDQVEKLDPGPRRTGALGTG